MDRSLRKLMKVMPPLKGQRHTKVNWDRLEEHVGLTYPDSFKDFVSVYGSSHWFDKLLPFYSTARTVRFAEEYVKSVREKLKWLVGNMYDAKYNKWDLPLYPEDGGLFPFLADIDGPLYCWLTESKNPSRWPVYCWMTGPITVLTDTTISGMLLGFLERSPQMVRVWGDVRDFDPGRIRIDDVCIEG
jgi:SMI1 / KNR4 family (SUKH-1)